MVGALLAAALLATAGCGLTAGLNRLRTDYIAQSEASQARELVQTGGDLQRAQDLAQRAMDLAPASLPVLRTAAEVFMRTEAWDRSLQAQIQIEKRSGDVDLYEMGAACLYAKREAQGTNLLEVMVANHRGLRATG